MLASAAIPILPPNPVFLRSPWPPTSATALGETRRRLAPAAGNLVAQPNLGPIWTAAGPPPFPMPSRIGTYRPTRNCGSPPRHGRRSRPRGIQARNRPPKQRRPRPTDRLWGIGRTALWVAFQARGRPHGRKSQSRWDSRHPGKPRRVASRAHRLAPDLGIRPSAGFSGLAAPMRPVRIPRPLQRPVLSKKNSGCPLAQAVAGANLAFRLFQRTALWQSSTVTLSIRGSQKTTIF